MKYFVVCPCCEYELLKAEDGSHIEIECPECNKNLIIEIKNQQITIHLI